MKDWKDSYMSLAKFWAQILGLLPGVKAIFLSGSLAQRKAHKGSDIDFFVVTKYGQIWTARFFIFVVLKAFKMLSKPKHHTGKICPNHFITDRNLQIQEKDAYSANLFSHNIPLYDPSGLFPFFRDQNSWITSFGEHFTYTEISSGGVMSNRPLGSFWKWLEKRLEKLQRMFIEKNPESKIPGAKIILNEYELRFHPIPKNKSTIQSKPFKI